MVPEFQAILATLLSQHRDDVGAGVIARAIQVH
jgi:hypothetical protein